MKKYFYLILLLLFVLPALGEEHFISTPTKLYEKDYNTYWCEAREGRLEATTIDGSRVDCLLPNYAVEGERAYKWKEAVGQSLFYGIQTQRTPAILLIVNDPVKDKKYIDRLNKVATRYGIKTWYITPAELASHGIGKY